MKSSEALSKHRAEIRSVVAAHRAKNARIFGSVLRGNDQEGSELDLLIDPTEETTLFDIARLGKNQMHLYPQIEASAASRKRPTNAVDFLHEEKTIWLCRRT